MSKTKVEKTEKPDLAKAIKVTRNVWGMIKINSEMEANIAAALKTESKELSSRRKKVQELESNMSALKEALKIAKEEFNSSSTKVAKYGDWFEEGQVVDSFLCEVDTDHKSEKYRTRSGVIMGMKIAEGLTVHIRDENDEWVQFKEVNKGSLLNNDSDEGIEFSKD